MSLSFSTVALAVLALVLAAFGLAVLVAASARRDAATPEELPPHVERSPPERAVAPEPAEANAEQDPALRLLAQRGTPEQRAELGPRLADERSAFASDPRGVRARPRDGRWGAERSRGIVLDFECGGTEDEAVTVLVVPARVDGGGAPHDVHALVPDGLPGVKRLPSGGGCVRWVGRGVFLPDHLLL